ERAVDEPGRLLELGLAADQRRGRRRAGRRGLGRLRPTCARRLARRGRRGRVAEPELGPLHEDAALELAQLVAGLDAELVDERSAGVPVALERVGLAARAVQREHQLRAESLVQRVLGDETLQLADELGVAAEVE